MTQYSPIEINYNPQLTYPGTTQNTFVGPASSPTVYANGTMALFLVQNGPFDQTSNAITNTNDLTMAGTVPFLQSPSPVLGLYCAGPFTTSNYFYTSSAFNTAFTGLSAYTIEAWVYMTSLASQVTLWSTPAPGGGNYNYIDILATGNVLIDTDGSTALQSTGTVAVNVWTNIAVTWNSATAKRSIYITPLGGATNVTSDSNSGTLSSLPVPMYIGNYAGASNPFTGYINGLRFSNVARTSFPTVDVTPRGYLPNFRNSNSIFISKLGSDIISGSVGTGTVTNPRLTLGNVFSTSPLIPSYNSATFSCLADLSGNNYSLTASSVAVPSLLRDFYPQPPASNYGAGPFSSTAYFNASSVGAALTTTFTFECYIWLTGLGTTSTIFQFCSTGTTNAYMAVVNNTSGTVTFTVNANTLQTTAALSINQWYHLAFTSFPGTSKIFINGALAPGTGGGGTGSTCTGTCRIGINASATNYLLGYIDRVVITKRVSPTIFPTPAGALNILALYDFESAPFIQTCTNSSTTKYMVFLDSNLYNETNQYINWAYNLNTSSGSTGSLIGTDNGIYALDGQAPAVQIQQGAIPGTYGARISGRTAQYSGSSFYYVAKSGQTYSTISAALTAIGSTSGCCVKIMDNGVYQEDLTFTALFTSIEAAFGLTPVLKNVNTTSSGHHFSASSSVTINLYGLTVDDANGQGSVFEGSATTFNCYDCTIKNNHALFVDNTCETTLINCQIVNCPIAPSGVGGQFVFNCINCYFSAASLVTSNVGIDPQTAQQNAGSMVNCTFLNQAISLTLGLNQTSYTVDRCIFVNSNLSFVTNIFSLAGPIYFSVLNSNFSNCGLGINVSTATSLYVAISNCLVQNYSGNAFSVVTSVTASASIYFSFKNCSALGCTTGFYSSGYSGSTMNGWFSHCTVIASVATGTYGINGIASTFATGFAELGCGTSYSGIATPAYSTYYSTSPALSAPIFIGTATGAYNIALNPTSPGMYTGNLYNNKCVGPQAAIIESNMPYWTINGLNFICNPNMEGAFTNSELTTFLGSGGAPGLITTNTAYCSVSGGGPFGIQMQYGTANNNSITTNGFGILNMYGTLMRNMLSNCGSAAIGQFSQGPLIQNCNTYASLYGLYEYFGSSSSVINCIFSGSGAYDYSGDGQCSYCCVGTLDPTRTGSIDVYSTGLDPLFRNIGAGDFRIQTMETGYFFNSPAKLAGNDGNDMGPFQFTYGPLIPIWSQLILINNPDQVQRTQSVIKLAEGDTEGGNLYSMAQAFQILYKFIWNENNPMPSSDLLGLTAVYTSATAQCQLSFDGGNTWIPVRVVRSQGFEWTDLDSMYNDNQKPTPLQEIDFRVSA